MISIVSFLENLGSTFAVPPIGESPNNSLYQDILDRNLKVNPDKKTKKWRAESLMNDPTAKGM